MLLLKHSCVILYTVNEWMTSQKPWYSKINMLIIRSLSQKKWDGGQPSGVQGFENKILKMSVCCQAHFYTIL